MSNEIIELIKNIQESSGAQKQIYQIKLLNLESQNLHVIIKKVYKKYTKNYSSNNLFEYQDFLSEAQLKFLETIDNYDLAKFEKHKLNFVYKSVRFRLITLLIKNGNSYKTRNESRQFIKTISIHEYPIEDLVDNTDDYLDGININNSPYSIARHEEIKKLIVLLLSNLSKKEFNIVCKKNGFDYDSSSKVKTNTRDYRKILLKLRNILEQKGLDSINHF
jgi:hypothetical protein